jgi:hypothetical protein
MASLRSRNVPGGTAPKQVAAALRTARKHVDTILKDVQPMPAKTGRNARR